MKRIAKRFERLRDEGRKGLITFITAGDPGASSTPLLMRALVRGGADIIELGVPFSDPMADGPVIQRASERALQSGMSLADVLDCVRTFRESDADTPIVLMGYLNPFERMGPGEFASRAADAGVDGVLIVDLPPEEARAFNDGISNAGLDQVFLVAPNSGSERIRTICEFASGFVYFVSVKGVTGGKALDVDEIDRHVTETAAIANLPVGVGFGIRTPESAARASHIADAIIVGSAIVELIEHNGADEAVVEAFVASLRTAIDERADAA